MKDMNAVKAAQLGMPFGTANARLRKAILFRLLQRLGEDTCFRCDEKIENLDELSIEHKAPWLYVNVELFWDLDNIAFSHLRCNIGAAGKPTRITCPQGQQWCTGCKQCHEIDRFPVASESSVGQRNGLRQDCRAAESRTKARWRANTGRH